MSKVAQAAVAALVLASSSAGAYVRTTSQHSGAPVHWLESCVTVESDLRGSVDVPTDLIDQTVVRAAGNWTGRTNVCSYLALSTLPATRRLDVAPDGVNAIVFRQQTWSHDPGAIGLTTVFFVDTPGRAGDASILDADVELNGVDFTFTTTPASAMPRAGTTAIADLENTLTHELGHVQGLAHTCWDHVTDVAPLDNLGNPIPDCNALPLPSVIIDATMYPYARMPGETSKRNLTPDDVAGVCDVYVPTGTPPACFGTVHAGCALAVAPRPTEHAQARALALAIAGLAAFVSLARGARSIRGRGRARVHARAKGRV
jgi:hypothetical protein